MEILENLTIGLAILGLIGITPILIFNVTDQKDEDNV